MVIKPDRGATSPVSIRLSAQTSEQLDDAVRRSRESRNSIVERVLREGLRIDQHPLIRFETGASGHRRAALVGTRLAIHQVIATVRAGDDSPPAAAEYLGLHEAYIRAAIAYYADFKDEVDADASHAAQIAEDERARWERQQRALA